MPDVSKRKMSGDFQKLDSFWQSVNRPIMHDQCPKIPNVDAAQLKKLYEQALEREKAVDVKKSRKEAPARKKK